MSVASYFASALSQKWRKSGLSGAQTLSKTFHLCFHSRFYSHAGRSRSCSELGLGALGKYLLWLELWGIGPRANGWVISRIIKTQSCISKWKQATFTALERTSHWVLSTADENPHKTLTADKRGTTERNCEFLRGPGFTCKHPDFCQRHSCNRFIQTLRGCSYKASLFPAVIDGLTCGARRQITSLGGWGGGTTHRLRSILQTLYKTQSGKFSKDKLRCFQKKNL